MSENQKGMIKLCKLCEELLPKAALVFSNRIAIEEGYCCWMCISSDLGEEKSYSILGQKSRQKMHERMRERRSQP